MSEVTDALLEALERVDLRASVERAQDPGERQAPQPDEASTEQFFRAFQALLREGLSGGREQRDLVMETAVPALVDYGHSPLDLVEGHVVAFTAVTADLAAAVPEHLRAEAVGWLARYAAGYTREVVERAQRVAGDAGGTA